MLRASDIVLLGVAASYRPLGVIAGNPVGVVHPERLVVLVLGIWAVAVGVALVLVRLGQQRSSAVRSVFLVLVVAMSGGVLIQRLGELVGWLLILAISVLLAFLMARLVDTALATAVVVGLAVTLMSGVVVAYLDREPLGANTVVESPSIDIQLTETPDMFLIVFDAYPGLLALELDAGDDKAALRSELQERGFQLPVSSWSAYWSTQLSVPSLLDMSYPLVEASGGRATQERLYEMVGGDARLVEILKSNGYETLMIESGWSGSSCGAAFDRCVPSHPYDEAMFHSTWGTVAGPYLQSRLGYPFTVGALRAMEWLLEFPRQTNAGSRPTFVFAHLVVPHPPFFLDESCEVRVVEERSGTSFYIPGVSNEDRETFFAEQVACVDRFMTLLADSVGDDDVVVFVSDHGTDRRNQLVQREGWSKEAIVERLNVLTAVRTGASCDVGDSLVIPNLMRRVLSCYTASRIEDLPNRIFVPEMSELDAESVESLLTLEGKLG